MKMIDIFIYRKQDKEKVTLFWRDFLTTIFLKINIYKVRLDFVVVVVVVVVDNLVVEDNLVEVVVVDMVGIVLDLERLALVSLDRVC